MYFYISCITYDKGLRRLVVVGQKPVFLYEHRSPRVFFTHCGKLQDELHHYCIVSVPNISILARSIFYTQAFEPVNIRILEQGRMIG